MFKIRLENNQRIATVSKAITIEKLEALYKLWKWEYLEFID